ncbi:carcinoembryonic antigen-related cell adhesion molecule 5-like [Oreochromis aureus]|uniref:Ig-like domain-containing protein n=1 Tax=Oreochromis aureus TaxID=47969 RepID=A0A668T8C7_OREAU|nr:carcinoembryonic antigen-related cell adhesion molecule 5-like [Oreochromis aureus]
MESPVGFILFLAAVTFTDVTRSQTLYASENPVAVGNNVTLSSNRNISSGGWLFNTRQIVITLKGFVAISKTWEDRVLFDQSTSSLTILSVKLEDSGNYTLQDVIDGFISQLTLSVEESVYDVTIQTSTTNLVEFNDTAVLMCGVSKGTSLSYQWFNGSSMITTNEKVQLSSGNTILTIMNVTRYDQGPYKCNVSNNVSNDISAPVNLNINYGPSNTEMTVMPLMNIYKGGSNITLSCSAVSSPPAIFQWMVNGVYLNKIGPKLELEKVNESMSGNYTCLIHNNVTFRFSSQTATIQIVDPVTAVVVKLINPAIFGETFSLSCEVTGPVDIIHWWRNDQLISADNKTKFDTGNRKLTISSTQHSDGGDYQCEAFNSVSNQTSHRFTVTVYYGPEIANVMGPNLAKAGDYATFTCNATSNPPSSYEWYFENALVSNKSEYVTQSLTTSMSGKYLCVAFNSISGKNSTADIMLTVVEPLQNIIVEAPMMPAEEGYSYNLTCNTDVPADYIYWMKNEEPLNQNNKIVFYNDNKTLHIRMVERYDNARYECIAINEVSRNKSTPYMLFVNYGPETPFVYGPAFAETGHQAVFNCSAESVPPSTFYWWFNGSIVANTSEYTINMLSVNMSGEYTCMAINNVTGKNSTDSTTLTVIEAIESVMIKNTTIPINTKNFTLPCEVVGPYDTIYWMKDNMMLNMDPSNDSHISYYIENNMLHFIPVTTYNDGIYQCVASNKAGQLKSLQYRLLVNYPIQNVKLNGPVTSVKEGYAYNLTCNVTGPADYIYWMKNGQRLHEDNRTFFHKDNQTVEINPVKRYDTGNYYCLAINAAGNMSSALYMLVVIYPIENVEVKAPMTPAIEGYSYNLTCNVTGPAEYIYWMKNGEKLHDDNRTVFYMENKMLHLSMVERYDNGNYCCMAINAFGNMTSPTYNLIVNYGPEKPIIYGPAFAEIGRQAVFSCSAMSVPPSQFFWWFNGSIVSNTSVYTTSLLSSNMSREYTCMAINNVTGKNSTNSTTLTVVEAIESVMIKNKTIPIDTKNFTLTCEVVGSYDTIYWMKDNMMLNMDPSNNSYVSYATENNMLHFTPVTLDSDGTYQCVATNKAGDHVSPQYRLWVNYGPLGLTISRASMFMYVSLTCQADSRPACDFSWFFNNQSTPLQNTPSIVFPATSQNFGIYTCKAWNSVTNITMYQNLNVTAHAPAIHFPYQGSLMMMVLFAFSAPVLFN